MSRHRSVGSYGHWIEDRGHGDFRLHYTVDRYYAGSRLRYPRHYVRDTDQQGAERFAKRWRVEMPVPKPR